jgi:hypothetical protein
MLCEERMITIEARSAMLLSQITKHATPPKNRVIQRRLTIFAQIME